MPTATYFKSPNEIKICSGEAGYVARSAHVYILKT